MTGQRTLAHSTPQEAGGPLRRLVYRTMTAVRGDGVSRFSSGCRRGGPVKPVPFIPHQPYDLFDLFLGHAISGLIARPRRHRPLVGVDVAAVNFPDLLLSVLRILLRIGRRGMAAVIGDG